MRTDPRTAPLALTALILSTLTLGSCSAPPAQASGPVAALPVTTTEVRPAPTTTTFAVSGLLTSETEARLSFKTGGIVQSILVKEGDPVKAGQLLAALNLTEIDAQADQANEALLKATRDLDRVRSLVATSVATQEQLDNAQTAFQVATRTREIALYNRQFSEIRASGPGVVVRKLMNEGEVAGPGTPVFLISGSAAQDWVLRVGLSDVQWAQTALGDRARLSFDAYPGTVWAAVLSRRASGAEPGSGLYQVDLQVLPGTRPLATGLFGRGVLEVAVEPGAWEVPVQAVLGLRGGSGTVLVPVGDTAEARPVTVVRWADDRLVVTGPLKAGDRVVDRGAPYVQPGTRVAEVAR